MSEPKVIVEGLSKVFRDRKRGEVRAVAELSFEAEAGGVFGLLGVNGAGKTTALRMLATMLRPTAGDARLSGMSVCEQPAEVRRRIGFMSTATSLYGRLTVREMVAYFGRLHGLGRGELDRRIHALFERFEMRAFESARCDKLSTGMKQKVSIVRTVLHDPEVMIFDEPTAGLDVLASRLILDFVRDCRDRGKCVLFSTHRMDEVEKLCDRVGVIHEGRLLCAESVAALCARTPSGRVEDAFVALVEGAR